MNWVSELSELLDTFCGILTSVFSFTTEVTGSPSTSFGFCSDVTVCDDSSVIGFLWGPRRLRLGRPLYTGFGLLGVVASNFTGGDLSSSMMVF